MQTYESKCKVRASADDVVKLLITPAHIEEEAKVDGAVAAKARVEKNEGGKVVIVVDREDPTREPGAKKGATEKNTVTIEWDLETRRNNWKVFLPTKGRLVSIYGTNSVIPDGDGCVMTEKGHIEIKLPLIGGIVERVLVGDLRKTFPKKAKLAESKLTGK